MSSSRGRPLVKPRGASKAKSSSTEPQPPLFTRRQTILASAGGTAAALLAWWKGRQPVYEQRLPSLPPLPVDAGKRVAIVYDTSPESPMKTLFPEIEGLVGGAVAGAGVGAMFPAPGFRLSRRGLLIGGVTAAAGGYYAQRGLQNAALRHAVESEETELGRLVLDLSHAGYHVIHAPTASAFTDALAKARRGRSADARTILLFNANGDLAGNGHTIIEGNPPLILEDIASSAASLPGKTLLALPSCHVNPADLPLRTRSLSMLTLNNARPELRSALGQPFFSSIRAALRAPNVVEATIEQFKRLSKRMPPRARQKAQSEGSGLAAVGAGHFSLH